MLNAERMTLKAAEALSVAARDARRREHPQMEGVHLLKALLEQEDGIVAPVFRKMEVAPETVVHAADVELNRRARVTGGASPTVSSAIERSAGT